MIFSDTLLKLWVKFWVYQEIWNQGIKNDLSLETNWFKELVKFYGWGFLIHREKVVNNIIHIRSLSSI